jgi:hypothetical protein
MAGDADMTRLVMEFVGNPELASPAEQAQILAFWRALFHIWSNTLYQNLNGTIDLQIYEGMVSEASAKSRSDIGGLGLGVRTFHLP